MATHNKMLKTKISQVAQQQAAKAAPTGVFPDQPQPNSKGHANSITLQSGTKLDGSVDPRLQNLPMSQQNEKETSKVINNEPNDNMKDNKTKEAVEKEKPYVPPPSYKPPIPYPERLAKSKIEGQLKKFVELF